MDMKMETRSFCVRYILAAVILVLGLTAANILGQENMASMTQLFNEELAKKVDAYLSQWDQADLPGCAVGAVKDGKLVYKRGFGMANLDYDVPNTPTTRFTVASTSKA